MITKILIKNCYCENSVVGHPNFLQQNRAFLPNTELHVDMAMPKESQRTRGDGEEMQDKMN